MTQYGAFELPAKSEQPCGCKASQRPPPAVPDVENRERRCLVGRAELQNERKPRNDDADDQRLKQNRFHVDTGPAAGPFADGRGRGHCHKHEEQGHGQDKRSELDNIRHWLLPRRQRVQRNTQVDDPVLVGWRQLPRADIHLNGWQDERRHVQHRVSSFPHGHEASARQVVCMAVRFENPLHCELLGLHVLEQGVGGIRSRQDAGRAVGATGDGGIDGIIKEDRLGLDTIYIQAKRWEGTVGRPEIQKFAGALQGQRANKGVFLTTSSYSREAVEYTNVIGTKIVLIGGRELAQLMVDHNVGVSSAGVYELKRIDSDYFDGE